MPNYKGHLVGGSLVFVILCLILQKTTAPVLKLMEWFLCTLLGSLFPDVDTKSKGQIIFYRLMVMAIGLLCLQQRFAVAAACSLLCMFPMIVRHRGIFHNYLFMTFVICTIAIICYIYRPNYFPFIIYDLLFFLVGLYSHIFLDYSPINRLKFFRT